MSSNNESTMPEEARKLVIKAEGISKCYQSYDKPMHRLWQSFMPKKQFFDEFWALKGVDLEVFKGETVGIVGRNGSGKSTLLQVIAHILKPTSGSVMTDGRISALLELGAGFNPDFTGIENAKLNATIMGLSREEFAEKLPDIIDFCGLGDFLYRPVKTYSSGMFVRLAFAVAINMNPDILIIDEALAVGDVRFQRKCFRRLDELKEQGVSILFVTHSTESVTQYCDRAIFLNDGELRMTGSPKDVVQAYLEMMFDSDVQPAEQNIASGTNQAKLDPSVDYCLTQSTYNDAEHRWGDQRATICAYELFQNNAPATGLFQTGDKIRVRVSYYFHQDIDDLIYGITIKKADGNAIYGTNSRINDGDVSLVQQQGDWVVLEFSLSLNLLAGDYFVDLGIAQDHNVKDNVAIDRRYDLIHIRVNETTQAFGFAQLRGEIEDITNKSESV